MLTKEVAKLTSNIDELTKRLTSNHNVSVAKGKGKKLRGPFVARKKRRLRATASDDDDISIADNSATDSDQMDFANDALAPDATNANAIVTKIATTIVNKAIAVASASDQMPSTSGTLTSSDQNATTSAHNSAPKPLALRSFLWADIVNGVSDSELNSRCANGGAIPRTNVGGDPRTPPNLRLHKVTSHLDANNVTNNAIISNVTGNVNLGNVTNFPNPNNVTSGASANNVTNNPRVNNVANSRPPRPTPIQLGQMERDQYSIVLNRLTTAFDANSFRWHQLKTYSLPRIFVDDAVTKNRIINWLGSNQYQFNTYAERGQRRKAFLIRGPVHGDADSMCQLIRTAATAAGVR